MSSHHEDAIWPFAGLIALHGLAGRSDALFGVFASWKAHSLLEGSDCFTTSLLLSYFLAHC